MKSKWAAKKNKKLKHLQETLVDHTILITTETSYKYLKIHFKKREDGLCIKQKPTRKINYFTVINFVEQTI